MRNNERLNDVRLVETKDKELTRVSPIRQITAASVLVTWEKDKKPFVK